ncbi:heme o synthase [Pacificimonas sp. WHA3]|uniref:Protoheme IX farnesyltransferase n=1 Tax=Pacificimonas pallii TaxID=2827236 RepID=A0ABS6SHC9_9SPHN|nr:heme o synthase [Pacificimonas pallii]MBV7257321.1 heme o synthase [Pacificimonas pallii]
MSSTPITPAAASALPLADWRDYFALTKPRVMFLVVYTAIAGLVAAPTSVHPVIALTAILCIAVAGGAAGAFNQWYEHDLDAQMKRTAGRPLPRGVITREAAFGFAMVLAVGSVTVMALVVNPVAAAILLGAILFYVLIYTVWLKRRTPQNIVIGGAAGAFPPMIGWAAATGDVTVLPLLMFGIIFLWTPPHFWALALFMESDYEKAGVPMLPVTHGLKETRRQQLIYTPLLVAASVAPWALGLTGALYGIAASGLGLIFTVLSVRVFLNKAEVAADMKPEKRLFAFSILYLFVLFGVLAVDRVMLV